MGLKKEKEGEYLNPDQTTLEVKLPSDTAFLRWQKKFYERVLEDNPLIHRLTESSEGQIEIYIKHSKDSKIDYINDPDFGFDSYFLNVLFFKPELSKQMQFAVYKTTKSFIDAVQSNDPKKVLEFGYFIFHEPDKGICPTRMPGFEAAYDRTRKKLRTVKAAERTTFATIHTHPPFSDDILKPSTIIETEEGYKGDLFALAAWRKINKEPNTIKESGRGISRPFEIILKEDLDKEVVKILMCRENEDLARTSYEDYIAMLKANVKRTEDAKDEEETCRILSEMGYKTWYGEISTGQFYHFPIFSFEQMKDIQTKLNSNPQRYVQRQLWKYTPGED